MSKGFKSEYTHSVDAKGRIIMPAKFRERLGETFVVTKGPDGCLLIYPNDEWENIENSFRNIPTMDKKARLYERRFFSSADDLEIDKQGRVLIKPSYREYAGIDKEAVLVGVLNRIEIWSKERKEQWESFETDEDDDEYLTKLGIGI